MLGTFPSVGETWVETPFRLLFNDTGRHFGGGMRGNSSFFSSVIQLLNHFYKLRNETGEEAVTFLVWPARFFIFASNEVFF